jgi:hypothetical protein
MSLRVAKILGAAESETWLDERGLVPVPHWFVEIEVATDEPNVCIVVNIYPEEWGFVFRRGPHVSSIRITDVPFMHGADDDSLLPDVPRLERLDELLIKLERRFGVTFQRSAAVVHANLIRATAVVRAWLNRARS